MHALNLNRHWASAPPLPQVAEILGEVTCDLSSLVEIPTLLVTLLPLDKATFAIVRQTPPDAERMLVSAGVEAGASGAAPQTAASATCMSFDRELDAAHRMLLNLHWGGRLREMSDDMAALLQALADGLARSLGDLLAWRQQPDLLGEPFTRINGKQWLVLLQLNSDLIEKEIADQLNMPPHTLHSYIKEIYRKLGVRSRMGAVRHLQQSVRHYRARRQCERAARIDVAPEALHQYVVERS